MNKIALRTAIRRLKRNYVRSKCFLEYDEIQRVLLFFNIEHIDGILPVIQSLKSDGKTVRVYCLEDDKVKGERKPLPADVRVWKKADLNRLMVPKKVCIDELAAFQADTLIDLTLRPSLVHDFMYHHTQASYRVGLGRQDPTRFDLLLAVDDQHDAPFFFQQLLFYLKSIRTRQ